MSDQKGIPIAKMKAGRTANASKAVALGTSQRQRVEFTKEDLRKYREAAGFAVQFEFILRATAESLGGKGSAKDLNSMYDDIMTELRPFMSDEDAAAMDAVNLPDLRDDIVHSRMSKAFGKLGGKNNYPAVARVASIEGDRVLDTVMELAAGGGRKLPATRGHLINA